MKFSTAAAVVMATAGVSAASHLHSHQHLHKRAANPEMVSVNVYELNGKVIPEAEVMEGLKNGTLVLANGGTSVVPAAQASPSDKAATAAKVGGIKTSTDVSLAGTGVGEAFPDGELSCNTFPSQYGAVALDYIGLGGWTGIQKPNIVGAAFDDIMTVTAAMGLGSGSCSEGSFCSYACPAGYGKSQWPAAQGATGQSVGGLQCKGGKLHLTRPSFQQLCQASSSAVKVAVQNTMKTGTAICRTDYPGTESETIPLNATPGSTVAMFCPDADTYYQWTGKATSAQYYLNPAGTSIADGCQWSTPGSLVGNYAPMNAGVGFSNGRAWVSIFPNKPTTDAPLDYNVRIEGDNMSGTCKYENGQFLGGANFDVPSPNGCTVSAAAGTITFVLY